MALNADYDPAGRTLKNAGRMALSYSVGFVGSKRFISPEASNSASSFSSIAVSGAVSKSSSFASSFAEDFFGDADFSSSFPDGILSSLRR